LVDGRDCTVVAAGMSDGSITILLRVFGVRRQSAASTALWIKSSRDPAEDRTSKAPSPLALCRRTPKSAATRVFAAAADFHHLRSLGILAVFAAVLAVLFGRTITRAVRAFFGIGISHRRDLLRVSLGDGVSIEGV